MNDITDILRHRHGLGLTRDQIAAAVGVSSGTVSHVLERAAAAGLTWPLPEDIDDDALRARLYPPCERDSGHAQPDWDAVIKELEKPRKRRRARLTRRQLWKEYRDEAVAQGGSERLSVWGVAGTGNGARRRPVTGSGRGCGSGMSRPVWRRGGRMPSPRGGRRPGWAVRGGRCRSTAASGHGI